MLKICSLKDVSSVYEFGGKAKGLKELFSNEFVVPQSFFIEATDDLAEIDNQAFQQKLFNDLEEFKNPEGLYDVAIRSSALNEDGVTDSLAGHYETILGLMRFEEVLTGIKKVILSQEKLVDQQHNKMGVVIQEFIHADYSGVIFSSNPLTFSKNESIVSFTDGCGDKLVSGHEEGTDVLISFYEDEMALSHKQAIPFGEQTLFELCRKVKRLEHRLGYPLDVEWTIRKGTGTFSYIQCRPLTSITKIKAMTASVNTEHLAEIPKQLLKSDKVAIRMESQKKKTPISDAHVIISNNSNEKIPALNNFPRSSFCQGYSAVVIYPKLVSEKVIRAFIGDTEKLALNSLDSQYSRVKSFPKYKDINECITAFVKMTRTDYWISSIIIQEIYSPTFTGVIKKEGEHYMIEIIRGHFFTKGTIPSSNYLVSRNAEVLSKKEVLQEEWYEISEGAVIRHQDTSSQRNCLSTQEIQNILETFVPFLEEQDSLVEFGLLAGEHETEPYLIDLIRNAEPLPELTSKDISQGILSHGKLTGKLIYIDVNDEESFDLHFHDHFNENDGNHEEKLIFACKKTSIELVHLIHSNDRNNIAFIFESGSILCHLSIVLRENNIPAIQIGSFDDQDLEFGSYYTINAESDLIHNTQRIQKING